MDRTDNQEISFDEFDEIHSPGPEVTEFEQIADRFMSRRSFLRGTAAVGASAFVLGAASLNSRPAHAAGNWLKFDPIGTSTDDAITLPKGFSSEVLIRWGDPLWSNAPGFNPATRGTGATQETSFGDCVDGMDVFETADGKVLLVVNNEFVARQIIFGNRESNLPENADDVRKGKAGHGVSVMELSLIHI